MRQSGLAFPGIVVAGMAVLRMRLMRAGFGPRLQGKIDPRQVESRRNGQQQDQAKAKPLPPRASTPLPNPVHAGSLGKPGRTRHPHNTAPENPLDGSGYFTANKS